MTLRTDFPGPALESQPGTLKFVMVGKGQLTPGGPTDQYMWGQWVIVSGTGGLANVHGRGTWWGPGMNEEGADLWYDGDVHFHPSVK